MTRHHAEIKNKDAEKLKTVNLLGNQQKITRFIACFISKDLCSYSTVENKGFQHTLHTIEPRYAVPSRRLLAENAIRQTLECGHQLLISKGSPAVDVLPEPFVFGFWNTAL